LGTKRDKLAKIELDRLVGQNIRTERKSRNITQEELAETLGVATSHIGLIERGERGATGLMLLKLSRALDKPIDHFFHPPQNTLSVKEYKYENTIEAHRKKIATLIVGLNDVQLDFIAATIMGVRTMFNELTEDDALSFSREDD